MKKALKITLISLSSLIFIIAIALTIILFNIFSPQKLTKIVNNNAQKFITCDFNIDRAELTFFKTFPQIGIDLKNTLLSNESDTIIFAKDLTAALNIREFINNKNVIINNLVVENGAIYYNIDEEGKSNFDIFKNDEENNDSESDYKIDLQKIKAKNVDISYDDRSNNVNAKVKNLDLTANGTYTENIIDGKISAEANRIFFSTSDSSQIAISAEKTKLHFDGNLTDFNAIDGEIKVKLNNAILTIDSAEYIDNKDITIESKLGATIDAFAANIENADIRIADCGISLSGIVNSDSTEDATNIDMDFRTDKWKIDEIIDIIPDFLIENLLKSIKIDGNIDLVGKISGKYSESEMPIVKTSINWNEGTFAMSDFPLKFEKIDGTFDLNLDLDNESDITIQQITATTAKRNKISASGTIKNLLGKMLCNIFASGKLHISDFAEFLPEEFTAANGNADVKIKTNFEYDPDKEFSLNDVTAAADCKLTNINLVYNKETDINANVLNIELKLPAEQKKYNIDEWLNAKIFADKMTISGSDNLEIVLNDCKLDAYTNDVTDTAKELKFATSFDCNALNVNIDTISSQINQAKGTFVLHNSDKMSLDYNGGSVKAKIGEEAALAAEKISLTAKTDYNNREDNILLQWSPVIKLNLTQGQASLKNLEHDIVIPDISANLDTKKCELKKANLKFGQSDVTLAGTITGIENYIKDSGLLKGDLNFTANYLNINEIMDIIDGFGAPDSLTEQTEGESSPFIVPFGVDMTMKTQIKKALFEDAEFRNIAGQVYIKDGILVLEEMGLTNDAAKMQLTAMYKTPRSNHLFLGFDFHLLDIKIDKLIAMIPEVDTILPMLKSFSGNAEFHFAAETYLKSNYDIKYSTLRGAAAINGHDLVVLDNETYRNISKKLLFNKKTENKIDSLSTEITIYKNEVDVYPFLLSIDKYSAIISGRHNLDMTYDYNISLLKPLRIGLDIVGTEDKLKFKVGKAKYATLFKPEKRKVVESNVLELKTLINKTLQKNVKEFQN